MKKPAAIEPLPRFVPRDAWALLPAPRVAAVSEVEVLSRRRFALAGVALALVAVSGGVLLGVGGRTLREGIA